MSVNYEQKDGLIYRDGVEIGKVNEDGSVEVYEQFKNYNAPVQQKFGKKPEQIDPPPNQETEKKRPPVDTSNMTVRELVILMQDHIEEECPEMSKRMGDRTPEVLSWVQRYDDTRRQVLGLI